MSIRAKTARIFYLNLCKKYDLKSAPEAKPTELHGDIYNSTTS